MTNESLFILIIHHLKSISRKEQERQFQKNLIIQAAAQIFSEKGFEKTTLDEIAEKSEFSKGSLYNFFKNKEDLFLSTLEIGVNKLIKQMRLVESIHTSTEKQTKAILKVMVDYFHTHDSFNKHRAFFQMMVNEKRVIACQASDHFISRMHNMHKNMTRFFASIFQNGIDSGELKQGDAQFYSEVFLGIIHHHIFMVNMNLTQFDQAKADQIFDAFFNGIGA